MSEGRGRHVYLRGPPRREGGARPLPLLFGAAVVLKGPPGPEKGRRSAGAGLGGLRGDAERVLRGPKGALRGWEGP